MSVRLMRKTAAGLTMIVGPSGSEPPPTPDPIVDDFVHAVTQPSAEYCGVGKLGRKTKDQLTVHPGTYVAKSNELIQDLYIKDGIINASSATNVHVLNCIIEMGPTLAPENGVAGGDANAVTVGTTGSALVEFSEIYSVSGSYKHNGPGWRNLTVRRCYIHEVVDGFSVFVARKPDGSLNDPSVLVNYIAEDNYITHLLYRSPDPNHASDNRTHNDIAQFQGGNGGRFAGNFLESINSPTLSTLPLPTTQAMSCIMLGVATAPVTNIEVVDNWFSGAIVAINGGGVANATGTIYRNKFYPNQVNAGAAIWLDVTDSGILTGDGTGNQNTWIDGTPVAVKRNA